MSRPIPARTRRAELVLTAGSLPADPSPALVYLARLSAGSRPTMRDALDRIATMIARRALPATALDWSALRYQHTTAIRSRLAEKYAPATVNKMLAALRGVLRESWRLGQLPAEDYQRAVDLEAVRGSSVPRGRALTRGEVKALVDECRADDGPAGARDAALLAVLYGAGVRRAEAVALDVADFDVKTGELLVRRGKGRKGRVVYATNGAGDALRDWLVVRDSAPGPLFYATRKGGHLVPARMTPQAVLDIVRRRARGAGVKQFSPHDLRRTFISELLAAGAGEIATRDLAGHASVQTTARYDKRGEQAKRQAAEMLHFPY